MRARSFALWLGLGVTGLWGLWGLSGLGRLTGLTGSGLVTTALAQPRRGAPDDTADDGPGLASPERREQVKKKIRTMRAFTLTEELALDEPTAGRLFPMLARFDDETDKLLQKRVDVMRRMRHVDTLRDPRAIEHLIDEALAVQRGFRELEDRRITELRKVLPPVQMAKLLVVMPALERRLENQLRKAIVHHGKHLGGARVFDDDDDVDDSQPSGPPRRVAPVMVHPGPSGAPGNTPPCDSSSRPCR
ncbi:MAG TPA: hypothetical protein VH165_34740 [Kofleriaceae bacterium]|nr:hypothetical protein [Kofleriaceae bacterium]